MGRIRQFVEHGSRRGGVEQLGVVRRAQLAIGPALSASASRYRLDGIAADVGFVPRAADERPRYTGDCTGEMDRFGERRHGLMSKPSDVAGSGVLRYDVPRWQQRIRDRHPSVTVLVGRRSHDLTEFRGQEIQYGLAILGHQRVDVDQQGDARLGDLVGRTSDRHAAVAGTAQHDVVEIFELEHGDDVLDVRTEH